MSLPLRTPKKPHATARKSWRSVALGGRGVADGSFMGVIDGGYRVAGKYQLAARRPHSSRQGCSPRFQRRNRLEFGPPAPHVSGKHGLPRRDGEIMRFDKLTTKFQQALADAQSAALANDNGFIEPQHLLAALLAQEDGGTASLLSRAGVAVPRLTSSLKASIGR